MANEYLIKQLLKVIQKIAFELISSKFSVPQGGATTRVITQALERLEAKQGSQLSRERIIDYVVCSLYVFRERGTAWKINQAFGPKSVDRFDTNRGRRYYEDRWLSEANLSRGILLAMIIDRSDHPQARYIYMPMEEETKGRMLNSESGFLICQTSTLGWSPCSICCMECNNAERCKIETQKKFPEIFRLRTEHGIKK